MQRHIPCWQLVFAAQLYYSPALVELINILMNTVLCSRDSIRDIHLHNSSIKKPQRTLDPTVPHTTKTPPRTHQIPGLLCPESHSSLAGAFTAQA